jgi:ankyrin repeat protein
MCACACKRISDVSVVEIIRLLVENHANTETYDKYCLTPLMLASRQNNVAVVEYLIESGVDVDKQDENGWTVRFEPSVTFCDETIYLAKISNLKSLSHACSKGSIKCVYALLRANANACLSTFDHMSPIDLAINEGYVNIRKMIESYLINKKIDE